VRMAQSIGLKNCDAIAGFAAEELLTNPIPCRSVFHWEDDRKNQACLIVHLFSAAQVWNPGTEISMQTILLGVDTHTMLDTTAARGLVG
jgi:hypothetical protein